MSKYYPVIGLEVHAQLKTNTKLFCGCKLEFGAKPNTHVCPVCLAMPGTLPVPNKEAIQLGIKLGLALNCEIDLEPMWTRKNYFYPDLPKGYQITQTGGIPFYDRPICKNGYLDIELADGSTKRIGITRIHLEEDAGKLVHDFTPTSSHFDANRCGTPLCEIVSEPDLRSPEEAVAYLEKLKQIVEYTEVGDANMEKGNLRCDANISLRPDEDGPFGTRSEIKNLNSFSNIDKAIKAEMELQAVTLDSGHEVDQTTKRFEVATGKTFVIRSKEDAHDYRYFPEPDMISPTITEEFIDQIRQELPELPEAKRNRFVEEFGITPYDAHVLTLEKDVSEFYDQVTAKTKSFKLAANWVISELLRELKDFEGGISDCKITTDQFAALIGLIDDNTISGKIAKTVFSEMFATGKDPKVIIEEKDLVQISDTGAIEAIINDVLDSNPDQLAELIGGKDKLKGIFVGQVMRLSKGKANPGMVNQLLSQEIAKRG